MGKPPSAAPIQLDQARAELIRAEELLKQRHANTRLVLLKQKEITAQLQEAKALVSGLQRRLKEESRQKAKHRAESLEKDQTIAELRRQLRQATSQSVSRPQTPSDEDLRSGVQLRERSEPSHRSALSVDSRNVSRRGGKRKAREEMRDNVKDTLDDMLNFVLEGREQACSLHERVAAAARNYLEEVPVDRESWAEEVAEAAVAMLLEMCVLQVTGQWADMAWSPSRWFDCAATGGVSREWEGRQRRSLVAAWCDPRILETDRIPWLLACLRMLEKEAKQPITYALLVRCIDEVLMRCSGDASAVPKLCCAVTVAMALCKMSGRLTSLSGSDLGTGLDLGMKLLVDIMGRYGPGAENCILALAVALEVWPELAVVATRSTLNFADAPSTGRQHDDLYEMALLTLRGTLSGKHV